ncbi:MAG: DNA adenine methylase [Candidatus Azambacteria bacterium]|nr:DNA adenine methylase [Candidatus Azambacteria bacterium]
MDTKKDINFALVEETRPPIYTAMKYWGKKPHNIWREYIKNYTPEDGLFLDPFAGSAISAFEAVKAGRKAVAFDLNPLTSFLIETFCSEFNKEEFAIEVDAIVDDIKNDNVYQKYFYTTCRKCGSTSAIAQSFKWENGELYEVGVECSKCKKNIKSRYLEKPTDEEITKAKKLHKIEIKTWYPDDEFYNSPSFSANFIECIGGNRFADLWTKRNLYVISKIFNRILDVDNVVIQKQLLLGFIKTIHLCTKMSVPRRENADRGFSTSWGRSAYICAARQMEMNPLLVFYGSCFGKQSVESSLVDIKEYLGKIPKILYVDKSNKSSKSKNFDIKYGIVDINTITDFIEEDSIDFIMTDPPYGGLVQYLDLSTIWLIWLKKFDQRFTPNYENEITVKRNIQKLNTYKIKFQNGIKNLFKVLKNDGKIVFTFHNKDIKIWNAFLNAIALSGFKIEKVIHQQNRRTGESNVANPYGTSASDFYIRCIKKPTASFKTNEQEFEHYVIEKTISLIAQRNEPTPFQILFNGLLAEISSAGFNIEDFDNNIEQILSAHIGSIFELKDYGSKAGKYWWFKNPADYIKYPDKKLTDRVEETITALLRRKVSVTLDEVLGEIFVKYPNGLTPDIKSVDQILKKFANKSGGKWIYKGGETEKDFTDHTEMLYFLSEIGKKIGYEVYIGKREQPENYNGKKLSEYADITKLDKLNFDQDKKARIEMIDMVWIKNDKVEFAIEVENSTNFTSGIQRASNLDIGISKLMVLPNKRKTEFLSIKDPLFVESFKKYNWGYLFYDDILKLKSLRNIDIENIKTFLNHF